jgi:hypothetical protein
MNMKKRGFVLFLFVLILFIQFSQASFIYKNNTLSPGYGEGQVMSGLINISFQNQTAYSNVSSNFGGNISLIKLLEDSGYFLGTEFTCSTINCSEGFIAGDSINNLNVNGKSYAGFRIPGGGVSQVGRSAEPNSVKFNVQSNIGPFCYNQLLIDITGKEERFIFNNKTNDIECSSTKNYGCFDGGLSESSYQSSTIGTTKYCANISLPAAPAYKVGAKVSKRLNGGNNATLKMILYNFNSENLGGCTLNNLTESQQDLECSVYYGSPVRNNFLVCIYATEQDSIYQIRTEDVGKNCGTSNFNNFTVMDPEVFARSLQSDSLNININNNIFSSRYSGSPSSYMIEYLRENYPIDSDGNVNCAGGCVIPIGFYGPDQNVSFSNIELKYKNSLGDGITNTLYALTKSSGKINSDFLQLDLSKTGFSVPYNQKPNKFILYLAGEKIFEKSINVTPGFTFDMEPKRVLIGQNSLLIAGNSSMNINSSIWDFGNDDVVSSAGNQVSHVFTNLGASSVSVTLTKNDGTSATRTFTIESNGANESAWKIVLSYEQRINNLSKQIVSYPSWILQEISKKLDVVELNASIVQQKKALGNAIGDEEILPIIENLLRLNVPVGLGKSSAGTFPISVGYNNIDPSYISDLSGAVSNSSSEEIRTAIIKWMNENYRGIFDFETIDAYSENGSVSPIMAKYRVTLNPNDGAQIDEESYMIINYPLDGLEFMQDYKARTIGSGTYILVNGASQTFEFTTTRFVKVQELGVYLSPRVSKLSLAEEILNAEKPRFNWLRFSTWTGIVIILMLILYMILQEWYKFRYESYLFKHHNDLYNIITFIFNSRNNKLNDNDIRKKLAGAGWNGEQITYAFKKIDGKRTGMFEIPLLRPFEKRKIRNEITKRQIPSNVNFIKGPRL